MTIHSLLRYSRTFLAALAFVSLVACEDDDPLGSGNLNATSALFEAPRGDTAIVSLSLSAEEGMKSLSLSVDGAAPEALAINTGANQQDLRYPFPIPANTTLNTEFDLAFVLTDNKDQTFTTEVKVNTSALISVPTTYAFMRDGQSTVSYSGQTERLDMLATIKSELLLKADAGQVVTEQALLDAFANTGGNGAGLFPFTSTKQLRNKTFQPDLDNNLFEGFFASLAEASVAGSNNVQAANGTAGLITRENKGTTILVDENGREFTQLVEKGLMGAVFYNQIYNVYLSDARTGDEVENVALSDGKNYTPKEHHWDEAFGYWAPPLDFTSPWPSERASEDRFWSHYSNTVDNVNNGQLGTNKIIMDAFIAGRAAVVNQDLETKNAKRVVLAENLDLVAAGVAVHYINSSIRFFNEGKIGELFHVLTEAWAFTNALRYNPDRKLELSALEEIMETDFGANGNFWNVTAAGMNKAKATIVAAYPALAPVQDDL